MLKICFILSSIGGPRMLSQLFSGTVRDDVAYVVIQRLAGAGLLDVLVECLREDLNRKILIAGHTLQLHPGAIHFLPSERNYAFLDGALAAAPGKKGAADLDLDMLFASAAAQPLPCAVAVLSGMLVRDEGLAGLAKLAAKGAPIVGTLESQTPVFDMIERIRDKGLMGELYPPKNLLEHLDFASPAKAGSPAPASLRVLVADDEEKVRTVMMEMLQAHGIAAESAVDGLDALRKIQKGRYDALLLDLVMPEMDGLRTLEALKTIDPALPIVVMTGADDPARVQAAKEFKLLGVLHKPFTWDKLKKLLPSAPSS